MSTEGSIFLTRFEIPGLARILLLQTVGGGGIGSDLKDLERGSDPVDTWR